MSKGWHIKDVYEQYCRGQISFDDLLAVTERGIAEYQQRQAAGNGAPRPSEPPTAQIPSTKMEP